MVVPPMASIGHRPCSLNSAGHWTLMSEQVLPLPGRDHCYCYSLLPEWIDQALGSRMGLEAD